MKSFARLALVAVLYVNFVIMGCAGLGKFSPPAQTAVDYICAGEEGKITAADMLAVLELGKAVYSGDPVSIEKAIAVLTVVKKTGCFVVAELQEAFKAVDAANAAKMQAKGPRFAAEVKLPEYPALRRLVK